MRKYTKKGLREFKRLNMTTDITNFSFKECQEFKKTHNLSKEGYSTGIYGITGGLMKDTDTGEYYVILAPNSTLLFFF